ncbi:MAG: hypothetical protein IPM90_16215 [Austwickia sp.]|nr:hypothetical protein [Austwickia sp.]
MSGSRSAVMGSLGRRGPQGVAAALVVDQPGVDEGANSVGEAGGVEVVDAAAEAYAVEQQAGVGVGGAEGVTGAG